MGLAVAAAGLVAYNGYEQNKANQQQRAAQEQALQQAKAAADMQDQANNRANAKSPNIASILQSNMNKGAQAGTMLTGPGGVDPSTLQLGKNTLLGS